MFTVDKSRRPDPSRIYKWLMACSRATHMRHLWLLFVTILCCMMPFAAGVGYSYTRFVGPVRGPEQQVYVTDANGGEQHLDYIAKPEYEFAYGVEDADARILHNRNEIRDGDNVKGVYSLVDPDGTLRVVKYTADNVNGFKAEVITNGISTLHGQQANGIDDYNNFNDYHYNLPTLPPSASPSPAAIPSPTPNIYRPNYDQYGNQPYQPPTYQPLLQLPGITSTKHPTAAEAQTDKASPHYKVHESQEDDDDYNDTEDDDDEGEGDEKEEKYADSEEEELEDYDEAAEQNDADVNASGEEY